MLVWSSCAVSRVSRSLTWEAAKGFPGRPVRPSSQSCRSTLFTACQMKNWSRGYPRFLPFCLTAAMIWNAKALGVDLRVSLHDTRAVKFTSKGGWGLQLQGEGLDFLTWLDARNKLGWLGCKNRFSFLHTYKETQDDFVLFLREYNALFKRHNVFFSIGKNAGDP